MVGNLRVLEATELPDDLTQLVQASVAEGLFFLRRLGDEWRVG